MCSGSVSVSREWREKGISKKTKKRETKKSGAERDKQDRARAYVCCKRKSIGGTRYMRTHSSNRGRLY